MYRSIVDWEWFKEHDMTCFFIYCLSNANLIDRMWRGVFVRRGQLIISRSTVCRELGIKERRYRTIISRLVKSGEITIEPSNTNTLVTICNWDRYQADFMDEASEDRPVIDQQPTNERPSILIELPTTTSNATANCDRINNQSALLPVQQSEEENPNNQLGLFFEVDKNSDKIATPKKHKSEVDFDFIVKLFHDRCPSFPRVIKITDKRKTKIRLRFEEMGFSFERLQEVFDKAENSMFLRGDNNRSWKADFDWMMANSQNWVKILEGKYDNSPIINQYSNYDSKPQDRYTKRRGVDSAARSSEDYSDTL